MTRQAGFKLSAKDYGAESVGLKNIKAFIMGKIVEPSKAVIAAVGQTLKSGARSLQAAGSFAVQKGEYLAQKAFAYHNIAGQVSPSAKPT